MKLGIGNINKAYLGSTELKKLMLGSTTVFDNTTPSVVLPSSTVLSWEAGDTDSYDSATNDQLIKNTEATPSYGGVQSDYDLVLGDTSAASTDDPSFNSGSPAYFSCDGGDFIRAETDTAFNKALHRTDGTPWTLALAGRFTGTDSQILWGNGGVTGDHGMQILCTNDVNGIRMFRTYGVPGSADFETLDSFGDVFDGNDRLLIFTYDPTNVGTVQFWNNSTTRTHIGSTGVSGTNSNPLGRTTFGSRADGGTPLTSGSRLYGGMMMDKVATQAEVEQIVDYYNQQFGWSIP